MDSLFDVLPAAFERVPTDVLYCVSFVPPQLILPNEVGGLDGHVSVVVPPYLLFAGSFTHSSGTSRIAYLKPCFSHQSL